MNFPIAILLFPSTILSLVGQANFAEGPAKDMVMRLTHILSPDGIVYYLMYFGLIVLLMAIRMVFPSKEGVFGESPSGEPFIVPLAVPAIAGPSTLATILVLVGSDPARMLEWLLVVLITCGISAVILVFADRLQQIVGERTTAAFERLMGLILATMAVQMFLSGITQFVQTSLKGAF